jgi:Domain of unknown function (DUF4136)
VELGKRAVSAVLLSSVLLGGLVFAGCNDNVEVLRDPEIHVRKGMTWAWRPTAAPPAQAGANAPGDNRPVTSRDVITPQPPPEQHLESNRDWNTEANRKNIQDAFERALKSKGLVQVSDPNAADFMVDYHVAVKTQRATQQVVYPGYPYGYGWGWGWYGWGGWGWGPPEVEFRTVKWHEGTFIFDLALRNPKKLAYRAISQKELSNKTSISPYQAEEAVNHLLKGLKPQDK